VKPNRREFFKGLGTGVAAVGLSAALPADAAITSEQEKKIIKAEDTLLKVYRDNLKRLVDRMDEFDYVYPGHFMVDVENGVLPYELEAIDAILTNPEGYDYKIETWGKSATQTAVRYAKHIRDFSVVLYGYNKRQESGEER
jgi:hypothetical protein